MRHWLVFTTVWAITATGFAVIESRKPTTALTEKQGWLSAPPLLNHPMWLKNGDLAARVFIMGSKVNR
jgi:hypothetical protein